MPDELVPNYIERPECGHVQVIMARPSLSAIDYSQRLVPELKEAIKQPCEECEKAKHAKDRSKQENTKAAN